MRSVLVIACFAVAISGALGAVCVAPANDVFRPSTCPSYAACGSAFCACVGGPNATDRNASTCLRTATSATCASVTTCLTAFTGCLTALGSERTNANAECNATGTRIHGAALSATVGGYQGSQLQAACRYTVCVAMNSSLLTTCTFGVNDSSVCMAPVPETTRGPTTTGAVSPATTRAPATTSSATAPPGTELVIRATIRLSGSDYAMLLADPAKKAQLTAAIKEDIARLLGISLNFIFILDISIGSLVIDFGVSTGSGATVAALNTLILSAATNTTWLSAIRTVYATVSTETIGVLDVGITLTQAPTTTTAAGGSGGSAAGVTAMIAAAAAVVLALAL